MFKKLFGGGDDTPRELSNVTQLLAGDIVSLKHRNELPKDLQGVDLEVADVNTYQYESCNVTEFTMKTAEDNVYFLSLEDDDGEQSLCFSTKIKRGEVLSLFDEDAFALLWEDNEFPKLVTHREEEKFSSWVADSYYQQTKSAQGYYYNKDCRNQKISKYVDNDDAEEFQYHECEGSDDRFGLSVEVWSDGSTDVFLQVFTHIDVIEQFHPHGN